MALSHQTRKRLLILYLCFGLPIYIGIAVAVTSSFDRPPFGVELAVYVALGVLWALPVRRLAAGTGRGTDLQEEDLRRERQTRNR